MNSNITEYDGKKKEKLNDGTIYLFQISIECFQKTSRK